MQKIGIICKPQPKEAEVVLKDLYKWLWDRGYEVLMDVETAKVESVFRSMFEKDPFFVERGGLDAFLDRQINRLTRRLASDKDLPLCDVHRAFLLAKDWQKGMNPDGVHPNPEGNKLMGEAIGRCLAAYVRAAVEKDSKAEKAEKSARSAVASARKQAESGSASFS